MPSFSDMVKRVVDRQTFMKQQEKHLRKMPKRKGPKPDVPKVLISRNIRLLIREAALQMRKMIMTYRKTTTGETKQYTVCPYSYRYRVSAKGVTRKMFFAYDVNDKHIKGFVVRSIKGVDLLPGKFRPLWPVEF